MFLVPHYVVMLYTLLMGLNISFGPTSLSQILSGNSLHTMQRSQSLQNYNDDQENGDDLTPPVNPLPSSDVGAAWDLVKLLMKSLRQSCSIFPSAICTWYRYSAYIALVKGKRDFANKMLHK
eukprot:TRINITY_DN11311_c0_g1_i1.p1 TRINITY_DN11311_c0_g1~~TRINITY_DN11311_c0_g1_i1.p1  ORF type:complete len:122 (-),score=19.97 TRINITY_DN11311_c0_g1_i1:140-505(-)